MASSLKLLSEQKASTDSLQADNEGLAASPQPPATVQA